MQSALKPQLPADELFVVYSHEPLVDLLSGGARAGLHFALLADAGDLTFRDIGHDEILSWSQLEAYGPRLVLVLCSDDELSGLLVSKVRGAGGRVVVLANLSRQWRDVADVLCEPANLLGTLTAIHGDPVAAPALRHAIEEHLAEILDILRKQSGLEFRHYRTGFAIRRIEQRMNLDQVQDIATYLRRLAENPGEARRLAESFSVRVTHFFRDPAAFEAIRERMKEMLTERGRLRVWSAGCASGEEAYSLAILAMEVAEEQGVLPTQIRILATDSNEQALDVARKAEFGPHIASQVSATRLKRYFLTTPTGYAVEPDVRQLVQFSRHNLLADAPFNDIDLILCRNVLIYLSAAIHEKLLCIFHYSLNPGGFLLLGSSETAGESTPLYSLVDERSRLYRRSEGPASVDWLPTEVPRLPVAGDKPVDIGEVVQNILQHEFTPRAAVVSEDGRIVWASGDLAPFLAMTRGRFRNQIVQLARKGLKNPLRSALLQARQARRTMRRAGVRVTGGAGEPSMLVDLTVQPMPELGDGHGLFLVVFQECPERQTLVPAEGENERLNQLEKDLLRVSEELERTVQELESANEELKSSNEELWAINEELRAANDELEKSRADIEQKNQQLRHANLDLNHLLTSTELPTIFLDHEQRVLRYTPSATEIYHLIESDVGRPLWQVRDTAVSMPPLPHNVDSPCFDELEMQDGRCLTRKILPYRDVDGRDLGMVVTFNDITDLRRSQTQLNDSLVELKAVYDQAPVGLAVLDRDLVVRKHNERLSRFSPEAELPEPLSAAARKLLDSGQPVRGLEFSLREDGQTRDCLASLYPLVSEEGLIQRINLVVQDVSALKQREREFVLQLRLLDNSQYAVLLCFLDGHYKFVNKAARRLLGVAPSGEVSLQRRDHLFSEDEQRFEAEVLPAVMQEGRWEGDFRWRHVTTGKPVHVWLECLRIDDPETGLPVKLGAIASDATAAHQAETQARRQRESLEQLLDSLPWGFLMVDTEARLLVANETARSLLPDGDNEGKRVHDIVARWEGSVSQQMTYAALNGESHEVIHQLPMNDRWYHSFYRPIADGAAIFFDDVTQTKQDEDRIRELAGLIDNSPDFIAVYDEQWHVRWINPAGLAMVGRATAEGLKLEDLHSSAVVRLIRENQQLMVSEGQWQAEIELVAVGGETVPVSQVVQPLRTVDGVLTGFSTIARNISEGKQRERLLQESELRFRRAILEAPIPVMILAEDGELLAVSDSLSQSTGYGTGEISHLSHWLLIAHREQADSVRESFNQLLQGQPMADFEAPVFSRSGQKRFWRFTGGGAGHLEDGRRYAVVMAVDLTDRLENEKALQEGAAFLRRLLDTLSTFVAVCSPEGELIEVNRASLEAAGLKPEQVLGRPFTDTYWWAYDSAVQQQLAEAIERAAAGKTTRYDVDLRIGSNQFLTIDFQIVPMRDDEGRITHLVPSATDITDRNRILSELEKGRESLQALLNSTAEAIYGLDDAGCFTFVNPSCLRLLGYASDAELMGKNAHWLCHHTRSDGTHFPAEECPMWLSFKNGEQVHAPRELLYRADGSTFWAEMWAHPLQSPSGRTGCVVTFWDISERLQQEGELSTAKAAAEAASRAKSDFLANMSHEIRTPMAAILGYVDILLRQATDPDNIECLQIIQRNGAHLLEIINDILDLSKIEAGRLHVEQLPVNVQALIAEVISLMQVRATEQNLDLQVHVDGLLPETISSDPTRLRQILMNLLGNAIKFTEAGWVKLSVRLLQAEQQLEFTVEDTGIGMPPETIQQLFRPFNQGDTSVTRRFGGTGLGLAISGHLVAILGGTIQVESAPGQGSVFVFTVGTGSMENVALVQPRGWDDPSLRPTTRAPLQGLAGRRILVADDRRDIRDLVRSYLEEAGAQVDTAGDGSATLKFLESNDVDVLVLDMQMPILDGYATARALRERGKDLPILALTASAMKGDREACVEAGCDGYLTKPVDRLSLIHQVHALAQRRRTLRTLIVEDNPLAGRAVLAMLHTMGCQSQLAMTAHEALEMVQQTPPDYILIDLGLPDMDGWELLARFRGMDILKNCRFIAHSGRELEEMSGPDLKLVFDAVVQKPATRDSLREVLFGADPVQE